MVVELIRLGELKVTHLYLLHLYGCGEVFCGRGKLKPSDCCPLMDVIAWFSV